MNTEAELTYARNWQRVAERAQIAAWTIGYTEAGQRRYIAHVLRGLSHGCAVACPWPTSPELLRRLLDAYANRYGVFFLKHAPPGRRLSRAKLKLLGIQT